jgi:Sec-independent protein translocase protein TatA
MIQRRDFSIKTAEAIREFREGMKQIEKEMLLKEKGEMKSDHQFSIQEQPYNDDFEISSELWTIGL